MAHNTVYSQSFDRVHFLRAVQTIADAHTPGSQIGATHIQITCTIMAAPLLIPMKDVKIKSQSGSEGTRITIDDYSAADEEFPDPVVNHLRWSVSENSCIYKHWNSKVKYIITSIEFITKQTLGGKKKANVAMKAKKTAVPKKKSPTSKK